MSLLTLAEVENLDLSESRATAAALRLMDLEGVGALAGFRALDDLSPLHVKTSEIYCPACREKSPELSLTDEKRLE